MPKGINTPAVKLRIPSSRGRLITIIVLFTFIALVLQAVIYLQGNIFDGVRSYVRGEGLWAKAQKDAILSLTLYSYSFSEDDYQSYLSSIEVNLGDKQARLALSQYPPNRQEAYSGFLAGKNSPLDIDSMIWFFNNFKQISYMNKAINIWQQADTKIAELISTAKDLRHLVMSPGNHDHEIATLRTKLKKLNIELLNLENDFSAVLGEGARWVRTTTWMASISLLVIFIGIGMFISNQIIKRITLSEKQLIESESRYRSLKDSNTIGIVSWNLNGKIEEANDNFLNILGYSDSDIKREDFSWNDLTPDEFVARDKRAINELLEHGRCEPYEKALLAKDGTAIPVYVGASSVGTNSQQGIAFVVDLSDRKKSEEQTRLAATVFASSNDGILITDKNLRILSANQALCDLTGYTQEELIGNRPSVLKSGNTTRDQYRLMYSALRNHGHWQGDIVDHNKSGGLLPLRISISSVTNHNKQTSHYVAILSDISERKAREDRLRQLAHYDTLTGLPNRALLYDRIEQLSKHPDKSQNKFALLFFDLDEFKPINDQHGHLVGDKLLQEFARRLSNSIRGIDMVTRLGGDEFIVLLENVSDKAAVKNIRDKIVESVSRPCNIDGNDVRISVSVGTSLYPEDGADAESLLHHADIAMYGMKEVHIQTRSSRNISTPTIKS